MIRLLCGDARAMLATLPDASVQCCVTSPPYFGLRDYGVAGQIGAEPTPDAYIAALVAVFREVRRVLRDDGTVWLNLGDSYNTYAVSRGPAAGANKNHHEAMPSVPKGFGLTTKDLKNKDLMMIPARVALALQADGWWLRSDIIWSKPNPMPESVTDRPTSAHEHVFLLTKAARYYFDADAVREEVSESTLTDKRIGTVRVPDFERAAVDFGAGTSSSRRTARNAVGSIEAGRNVRNVWTIATSPYAEAHFATFPPELAERCIRAGTSERGACAACGAPWVRQVERASAPPEVMTQRAAPTDGLIRSGQRIGGLMYGCGQKLQDWRDANPAVTTGWAPSCACPAAAPVPCVVLDPFAGACTTLMVANRLQRDGIGIELNPQYVAMGLARIENDAGLFAFAEAQPSASPQTRPDVPTDAVPASEVPSSPDHRSAGSDPDGGQASLWE